MTAKNTPKPDPVEVAFRHAQRLAAKSQAVLLTEAALDLTPADVIDGIHSTRDILLRAYRANGISEELDLATDEGAYLYGLAVGVALGKVVA